MPNVVAMIVGPLDALGGPFAGQAGLYVKASNGLSVALTKAQVQAFYQTTTGNAATRKAAVIAWVQQQIVAAVGVSMIVSANLTIDVNTANGSITDLEVVS